MCLLDQYVHFRLAVTCITLCTGERFQYLKPGKCLATSIYCDFYTASLLYQIVIYSFITMVTGHHILAVVRSGCIICIIHHQQRFKRCRLGFSMIFIHCCCLVMGVLRSHQWNFETQQHTLGSHCACNDTDILSKVTWHKTRCM